MFSKFVKTLMSLAIWAALAAGVAIAGAATAFGNFIAVVAAPELQG